MAQQDEGWPLGLQPLNARIGLARNLGNSGSVSFNTLITASLSSSSTDFSSDLDTQSTGSFFPDKSTTLGSLIGVSSILKLSRRSLRGVKTQVLKSKKDHKSNWSSWLLCVCSRTSLDDDKEDNGASLGHYLAEEREAANENRRNQNQSLPMYGPEDEFVLAQTGSLGGPNSLFVNGNIAPPIGCIGSTPRQYFEGEREKEGLRHSNGFGSLLGLFPCVCGQAAPD